MNSIEFQTKVEALRDKLGIWNIAINKKKLSQFTLGYYLDNSTKTYIVYEVDERQNFRNWGEFTSEDNAVADLYDLIKYRLWID
ncbi:hypothetical protein ACVRXS_07645 [Streptococcus orisratti]|uniref:hypothetical protein n=1 Tax=Streptococcus orisratti TaxID=114652 RepID=UPI00035F15C9|nr:hypothetical protein [Streptococcus orisratti]